MSDVKVQFQHPVDGRLAEVELEDSMTAAEAVENLIDGGFVQSNPEGYELARRGGALIDPRQSFAGADIVEGDIVRVIPATVAGVIVISRERRSV